MLGVAATLFNGELFESTLYHSYGHENQNKKQDITKILASVRSNCSAAASKCENL